jgi:hypothetical protein
VIVPYQHLLLLVLYKHRLQGINIIKACELLSNRISRDKGVHIPHELVVIANSTEIDVVRLLLEPQ